MGELKDGVEFEDEGEAEEADIIKKDCFTSIPSTSWNGLDPIVYGGKGQVHSRLPGRGGDFNLVRADILPLCDSFYGHF